MYIYIGRERERDREREMYILCIYIYIHTYTYIHIYLYNISTYHNNDDNKHNMPAVQREVLELFDPGILTM